METLATKLAHAKAALLAQAPRIVETYTRTVLALMVFDLQSTGIPGASYSTKQVGRSWFKAKAFNAGGRAYASAKGQGSYAGFRAALGLQTAFVDATFTGRTLRSLNVAPAGAQGFVFRAKIVSSNPESAKVVGYLQDRYPRFLVPGTAQVAAGRDYVRAEALRVIKQVLNG